MLVTGPGDIDRMVEEARAGGIVGLDTEFMREKTYRAKLCLVQVSTRENLYLIDPLEGHDLAPVGALIADPAVTTVVHAGRQDLEIFFEEFGVTPAAIFDVQVAAGFAGLGASLPYGRVVEATTGTVLVKGESYSDWCRRPLTEAQVRYAADDVRYLLVITDVLRDKLRVSQRSEWVEDEMRLLENPDLYRSDPADAWRRVSGRGSLSGKQTAVLRELAAWREETASKRDIPRGWVIKDQSLIEIARRGPRSANELRSIRGLNPKEAERSAPAIAAAVERGHAAPVVAGKQVPSRSAQVRARTLSGLADAIVRSRCEAAGIASELVTTRSELESLLAHLFDPAFDPAPADAPAPGATETPNPDGHRLLTGWRKDLAGDAVVDLARGRIAVRSIDRPPYIQEVPL